MLFGVDILSGGSTSPMYG